MDLDKTKTYVTTRFYNWLYRDYRGYDVTYYGKNIPIPDHTYYKVDNIPELVNHKNSLEYYGLKDPWIRNEVWRFGKGYGESVPKNFNKKFIRGWKQGLVLAVLYTLYCNKYYPNYNSFHDKHAEH